MISRTAEYALRAMVALGSHRGRPLTTQQIAERTGVPPGYLSKVLQALARAGLVAGHRGLGGGFAPARPMGAITVLEVIHAVDPPHRVEHCPMGRPEHGLQLCALHRRLNLGVALLEQVYGQTTIEELLDESDPARALCMLAGETGGVGEAQG